MSEAVKLAVVLAGVALCMTSCGSIVNEGYRIAYEAKARCFEAGGEWDSASSKCARHE